MQGQASGYFTMSNFFPASEELLKKKWETVHVSHCKLIESLQMLIKSQDGG